MKYLTLFIIFLWYVVALLCFFSGDLTNGLLALILAELTENFKL